MFRLVDSVVEENKIEVPQGFEEKLSGKIKMLLADDFIIILPIETYKKYLNEEKNKKT